MIILNSGDGQDKGGREGRHADRVRGEAAAAGGGAGAEEAHRGLQVDQEVQRVQHQQPLDQTPRYVIKEIIETRDYVMLMRDLIYSHQAHLGGRHDGHGGDRESQVARRRRQRHPARDGRGRRHEVLREWHRHQCAEVRDT